MSRRRFAVVAGVALAVVGLGVVLLTDIPMKLARKIPRRTPEPENLKEIGIAFQNAASAFNGKIVASLPKPAPETTPLVSWRYRLVPNLPNGFDPPKWSSWDEPWDGPNNKKLLQFTPRDYVCPREAAPTGMTYYKVFVGGGAAFDYHRTTLWSADFTDGTANTIMVVEGGPPVFWTKPEDIPYDPNQPLPDLTLNGRRTISVLMADGSVRTVNLKRVSETTLRAAITRAGGDLLGPDW